MKTLNLILANLICFTCLAQAPANEILSEGFSLEALANFNPEYRNNDKITVIRKSSDYNEDYYLNGNKVENLQFRYMDGELVKYSVAFNVATREALLEKLKLEFGLPVTTYYTSKLTDVDGNVVDNGKDNVMEYRWEKDGVEVMLILVQDKEQLNPNNDINFGRNLENDGLLTFSKK